MRTKLFGLLLLTSLTLAAQPFEPPRGRGPGRGGPDFLPPPNWFHDPYLSEEVNLSNEQIEKLEDVQDAGKDEMRHLELDIRKADKELRDALGAKDATTERIVAAGNRLASLRDQLLRKQVVVLANQRAILTHEQWNALQQQLEERRERRPMDDRGFPPGGMRGGRPRGGMRPPR